MVLEIFDRHCKKQVSNLQVGVIYKIKKCLVGRKNNKHVRYKTISNKVEISMDEASFADIFGN